MTDTTLAQTLLLQPGQRARLVNVPKAVKPLFDALPDGVHVNESGAAAADWLIVFVRDRAALDAYAPVAVSEAAFDGVLWVAFPKDAPSATPSAMGELSRAAVEQAMAAFGYDAVASEAVDGTWTALRFRPRERVAEASGERSQI
ncbi:hypothetical protein [Azospirillum sp.]|uniref:hypothetical protein n=1 Tax=Azospirillum sp. TaxID=34012 RepID=UPI002D499574|nr:hypothetical protein [Azospirillum sp.]HYD64085.1 hypothetical protein [Azospirillum sp.]